jgi:hypothetical protein
MLGSAYSSLGAASIEPIEVNLSEAPLTKSEKHPLAWLELKHGHTHTMLRITRDEAKALAEGLLAFVEAADEVLCVICGGICECLDRETAVIRRAQVVADKEHEGRLVVDVFPGPEHCCRIQVIQDNITKKTITVGGPYAKYILFGDPESLAVLESAWRACARKR